MHSETAQVHTQAVALFTQLGIQDKLHHKVIINCFDRSSHLNAILERSFTVEELTFLSKPGHSSRFCLSDAAVFVAA